MFKLIHGPDSFLSLKYARDIVKKLAAEKGLEVTSIDAEDIDPQKIITILSTPSMFQQSGLYFIKRIYRNKKKDEVINSLLNLEGDNRGLYVIWEDQKINKTTQYFKFFGKEVETFEKGDKRTLITWIKSELDRLGMNSDIHTIRILSSRCNYDAQRVSHIIEKLELSEAIILTEDIIGEISANTLEVYGWDLTDAINKKDREGALIIFEELLSQQVDPNIIIAMISNNLKNLAQIIQLNREGLNQSEISKALKLHPFVASKLLHSAKLLSWKEIQTLFQKLFSLDVSSKRGDIELQLGITLLLSKIH